MSDVVKLRNKLPYIERYGLEEALAEAESWGEVEFREWLGRQRCTISRGEWGKIFLRVSGTMGTKHDALLKAMERMRPFLALVPHKYD